MGLGFRVLIIAYRAHDNNIKVASHRPEEFHRDLLLAIPHSLPDTSLDSRFRNSKLYRGMDISANGFMVLNLYRF